MLCASNGERSAPRDRRQIVPTHEHAPSHERAALALGRQEGVDQRDLSGDLLGRAAHQGVGEGGGSPRPPREADRGHEAVGGDADELLEHGCAGRQGARERRVLQHHLRQGDTVLRRCVRIPPGRSVDRVTQAGEAVAGVVQQQRGELVDALQAPHAVGSGLGTRQRPRRELGLVPVQAPVPLDLGETRRVGERQVERRLAGAVLGAPAERLEGGGRG